MRIPHLSYGSVTATVALFLALGGSSYAALTITGGNIKNGTVTGSDVKDESIKGRDIDNGTLTGSDLKNGSVTSSDIGDGTLTLSDFKSGVVLTGPPGAAGPQGEAALTNAVVRKADQALPADDSSEATASCAPGEIAIGGGAGYSDPVDPKVVVLEDEPYEADGTTPEDGDTVTQWHAGAANHNTAGNPDKTLSAYVLCAKP
jgi:hypothetical protein